MKLISKISAKELFGKKGCLGWSLVFLLALLFHFCCSMIGWNHSLLEHHSYRQSQTAVAVEYMIRDHAWIDYITPVLGPPWQVPMEFPLFQMVVACLCLLLNTPIDQTGRAVSLFFFYASFWPMNLFLRQLVPEKNTRFMMMTLVLLAPVYIYFSRCVMIESTAFFLGFCFLAASARQILRPTFPGMVLLFSSGILCALVKITTFCAFCFPCLIYPILHFRAAALRYARLRMAAVLFVAYAIPLGAGLAWTRRADGIKMSSIATEALTSSGMNNWNFGSMAQRFDYHAWLDFSARISFGLTFWPFLIGVLTAVFFIRSLERRMVCLLLVSAALPCLVFFNLYVVHDYYFYASSVFLIFAVGYLFSCLLHKGSKWGKLLWAAIAASFIGMYFAFLLPNQWQEDRAMMEVIQTIRSNSSEGDFLLIYGEVWNSRLPYYSNRKAFMNFYFDRERLLPFDARLEKIEGYKNIRLAVINGNEMTMIPELQANLKSRGFPEKPDFIVNGFSIFRKR